MGATKEIFDLILELIRSEIQDRKLFFENQAEPLNKKIRQIHEDCVSSLKEVRDKIDKRTGPSVRLIAFLQDCRLEREDERKFTRDLAHELSKSKHTHISGDLQLAIQDYCTAILKYFAVRGTIVSYIWYTDFINTIEIKAKPGAQEPLWAMSMSITGNPRFELLKEVEIVLDERLPKAFENVSASYARLKVLLI